MDGKDSLIERFLQNADVFTAEQVQETIQLLLEHGITWQASDIHIEPHNDYVLVRYRVDGNLQSAHKMPRSVHKTLTHHLKSKAALRTTEPLLPQQGSFQAILDGQNYDIDISTMPVIGGEKIVLHVATQVPTILPLHELGYWGTSLHTLQIAMGRSHGLTIVAAPRHHGRPMTMASLVQSLQNPALNIATIEEKADYRIPHANQTVVQPAAGFTMLQGLQAALHQDPNVVLLGNIPDRATAELTIQTALSGHLVVAGMYSDSAVGALLQLQHFGTPSYLIASGIKTVAAQRLVRKLCSNCRERYQLSEEQLSVLCRVFGVTSTKAIRRIHELEKLAHSAGLGSDNQLSSNTQTIHFLWRARKGGCSVCHNTGYQGRTCIGEVLQLNNDIQKALHDTNHTAASMQALAVKNPDFVPLALDGLVKALRGLTTIKDVLRVVDRSLRVP